MMMTMTDDDKLCNFGLSFVIDVCFFVCARSSINKIEEREWETTRERIHSGT
jgi:hypothetical protein